MSIGNEAPPNVVTMALTCNMYKQFLSVRLYYFMAHLIKKVFPQHTGLSLTYL